MSSLAQWYERHGRHELAWRATTERWPVLVSEVMLAQTQVARVAVAWPLFMARFPTVDATAAAPLAAVIEQWGRLGYPLRARRLWETASIVQRDGWPDDYRTLPGVGDYIAGALAAQADGRSDAIGIDVNIRRVVRRCAGSLLSDRDAAIAAVALAAPLVGRDRLLALMDLGASHCTPRNPDCAPCPLSQRCATRGPLDGEVRVRQAPYVGSMRQRRGQILEQLRHAASLPIAGLDADALATLLKDRLVEQANGAVRLARA